MRPRGSLVAIFVGLFTAALFQSCSFPIGEWNEVEILSGANGQGTRKMLVARVLRKGHQYLFMADGSTRRLSFSRAEYSLKNDGGVVELSFLEVEDPARLWDAFAQVGGNWYAVSYVWSSDRPECLEEVCLVQFDSTGEYTMWQSVSLDVPSTVLESHISNSGEYLILKIAHGREFQRYFVGQSSTARGAGLTFQEIDLDHFARLARESELMRRVDYLLD